MTYHIKAPVHQLLCALTYSGGTRHPYLFDLLNERTENLRAGKAVFHFTISAYRPWDLADPSLDYWPSEPAAINADIAAMFDVDKALGVRLSTKVSFQPTQGFLSELRAAFKENAVRTACGVCKFQQRCTAVANRNFDKSFLLAGVGSHEPLDLPDGVKPPLRISPPR